MKLKKYLKKTARGTALVMAKNIGICRSHLSQIANEKYTASARVCIAIENATGGVVTRKDLRPLDWKLIWPELKNK